MTAAERAYLDANLAIDDYYHQVSHESAEVRSEKIARLWYERGEAYRRLREGPATQEPEVESRA